MQRFCNIALLFLTKLQMILFSLTNRRNIFRSGVNNPWKLSITYENLSPWIGPDSRLNDKIPNTEYRKGATLNQVKPKKVVSRLSHDEIISSLLENGNVGLKYV